MKQLVVAFLPLTLLASACGEAGDVQTPLPRAMDAIVDLSPLILRDISLLTSVV